MSWPVMVVAAVAVIWLLVEGAVIAWCATAVLPGGGRRLRRLGYAFLASEAWTLVLLGTLHGITPGLSHGLYHWAPVAPMVFVFGWMLRDLGLWLGTRIGRQVWWRVSISVGSLMQAAAVVWLAIGWVSVRPALSVSVAAPALAATAIPVLVIGIGVQLWLVRVQRAKRALG